MLAVIVCLGERLGDDKQQPCLDTLDLGEVLEHSECHQLKLPGVCILGALACLVIQHPCRAIVLDDDEVSDTTPPHVRVFEPARLEISGQAHLVFAQLSARPVLEVVQCTLGEMELRGQWLVITDVELSGLMELGAIG